jgi:hypothetical protein
MTTTEQHHGERLRAERQSVEHAAAWLRQNAWQEHYAGFGEKDRALQLATLMESLSLQLDHLPDGLRTEAVRVAARVIGEHQR